MEAEFLEWVRHQLPRHPQLLLGAGDDAAILELAASRKCVVSVDMLHDGTDFELQRVDPHRIGHKALAINLSDLAAMAVKPVAAVVAFALPRSGADKLAVALLQGMLPLAEKYNVAIAGGDTGVWDGPLVISVTVIGEPTEHPPIVRSGAQPGDAVLVTGSFGGSILGHHLDFQPRIETALYLNAHYQIHAGMDVSDGLSLDLSRLAGASNCGAVIDPQAIPIRSAAYQLALSTPKVSALEHALSDGEDFELLLAVPSTQVAQILTDQNLGVAVTRIGTFCKEPGLFQVDAEGRHQPLKAQGYLH